jgi:lipopolysaccharide export system protein LptA
VAIQPENRSGGEERIDISYKGGMDYSRLEGRIRFSKSVFLKQGDLRIRSENLDLRLAGEDGQSSAAGLERRIRRIVAETDVVIQDGDLQRDGREATAQRAEYESGQVAESGAPDANGAAVAYILRLFGPPQRTPPHPVVRDSRGNQISAPEIHMRRLIGSGLRPGVRERRLIFATGGTIASEFVTRSDNALEAGKVISIKCEQAMEYNEANELAWFEGDVLAVSDDPKDSYTLVSDRLIINLPETPNPDNPEESLVRIRRIDANGKAVFRQDERTCEANRIIRDFPTQERDDGDIYLEGVPARDGLPPQMAVYREEMPGGETGAMFVAPRIMSSALGDLIRANGPGQLSTPDEIPGLRSEIHFEGAAHYETARVGEGEPSPLSFAKFRRGVFLRQPSRNLTLRTEELDATFERPEDDGRRREGGQIGKGEDGAIHVEQVGRLTRAEARSGVVVEHALPRQGRRVAAGDRGVIEFRNTGNIIRLSANRQQNQRRFAVARDNDGKMLTAPDIEIREGEGFTRASGPGELQLPGAASGEGMVKNPTRVIYGERGQMVYNELGLNIRTSDNVRIVQAGPDGNWSSPSLDGRCDRLEIFLLEPPSSGARGSEALAQISRMDAFGGVVIRSYADPPPANPGLGWLLRPGITFFTRGDQAEFLPREGRIVISSQSNRRCELLLNVVDEGSPPRKQRLRADRFVLNTNTMPRRWTSEGRLESQPLGEGEPFEFAN